MAANKAPVKHTKCQAPECDNPLTGRQLNWCSPKCRSRYNNRDRKKARGTGRYATKGQRGATYDQLKEAAWLPELMSGLITIAEAGRRLSVHPSTVQKAWQAILVDTEIAKRATVWEPAPETLQMLGLPDWDGEREGDRFEAYLDRAVDGFVQFRDTFFWAGPRTRYITAPFHRTWIRSILKVIYQGGKQMILSPPRHGKSELLIHFSVWLICRNPDIRIVWVSGNGEIANDMVSSVKEHLQSNLPLLEAVLPPGTLFKADKRDGNPWTRDKFKVSNGTVVGQKGNTMVALGKGSKILSRDADFIIADDIEDHETTLQPKVRADTRNWFMTTLDSRAEEHTGWVIIGSRQHPDDLYGYLLDDPEWRTIVDSAHDELCPFPPDDPALHSECMLFPQLRSYKWLISKRTSARSLGLEGQWEMVYLNQPQPEGMTIFVREEIEACYNWERTCGVDRVPEDLRLVAGLDPASTGYQAAWCWGWSTGEKKLYVVDMSNRAGGGIDAFLELAERWRRDYGLAHWVVEDMGFQKGYRTEKRVRDWATDHGVHIEGHTTGSNKADPYFGVGATSALYRKGIVDLPYGDVPSREKTQLFTRQAIRFVELPNTSQTGSGRRNRNQTDLLMSSWFPIKVIRRWQKEQDAHVAATYETAYPGWDISNINQTPW